MPTFFSWLFVAIATLLLISVLTAMFSVGQLRLGTSRGLEGDGMVPGATAPRWERVATTGMPVGSPSQDGWQLLLFADHSLMEFMDVLAGVNALQAEWPSLEVVLLARDASTEALSALPLLGLDVPMVTGHRSIYHMYNVRVMPFVIFVHSSGRIGSSSLVNYAWQVETLWRTARAMAQTWMDTPALDGGATSRRTA